MQNVNGREGKNVCWAVLAVLDDLPHAVAKYPNLRLRLLFQLSFLFRTMISSQLDSGPTVGLAWPAYDDQCPQQFMVLGKYVGK